MSLSGVIAKPFVFVSEIAVCPQLTLDKFSYVELSESYKQRIAKTYRTSGFVPGDEIKFGCVDGFELNHNGDNHETLVCLGGGYWNAPQPHCKAGTWHASLID